MRAQQRRPQAAVAFESAMRDHRAGRLADAKAAYRQVITVQPNHFGALINLGLIAYHAGNHGLAADLIGKASRVEPNHAGARSNLGNALAALGRLDEAASAYGKAIELDPSHAVALSNLGNTLRLQGKLDRAVAACERAIELRPEFPDAHNNLGSALLERRQPDAAIAAFQQAVRMDPDHVTAIFNLGNAHYERGDLEDACAIFLRAVRLKPDYAKAHKMLGSALRQRGRFDAAAKPLDDAISIDPADREAFVVRAQNRLAQADFAGGWCDYLMRPTVNAIRSNISQERLSSDLRDKRVLVLRDQGLGDEIFFLRFIAMLKDLGAWIAYRPDAKIAGMVRRLTFIDCVVGEHEEPDAVDLRYSIGDLPFILGMTATADIPPSIGLTVSMERAAAIRARLRALGPLPYIGVTWRAGTDLRGFLSKETPLEGIAGALRSTAGTVVVLQRNPRTDEIGRFGRALGRPAHDFSSLNDDLEAMLALVDLIDDYVCVSNTNVHLRAATGHKCRVLVPNPPDFKWMATGRESPWFPGTCLYRESPDGGGRNDAFEELTADLIAAHPLP